MPPNEFTLPQMHPFRGQRYHERDFLLKEVKITRVKTNLEKFFIRWYKILFKK